MLEPADIRAVVEPLLPELEEKYHFSGDYEFYQDYDHAGDPAIFVIIRTDAEGMTARDVMAVKDVIYDAIDRSRIAPDLFPYIKFRAKTPWDEMTEAV